jgi:hypothetical protein
MLMSQVIEKVELGLLNIQIFLVLEQMGPKLKQLFFSK